MAKVGGDGEVEVTLMLKTGGDSLIELARPDSSYLYPRMEACIHRLFCVSEDALKMGEVVSVIGSERS